MGLTAGCLFSGIGAMDLGLESEGIEIRWQVENDPWCTKLLERRWPNVNRYGDVRSLDPDDLEPVDIISGGFPCQPVSVAGSRRGRDDDRWLWPHFARLVRGVRPRFVLVENVSGLLVPTGDDEGWHPAPVEEVLGDLATLGYDTEWQSVPAAAVGAPHLRWRVFLVARLVRPPGPPADADGGEVRVKR